MERELRIRELPPGRCGPRITRSTSERKRKRLDGSLYDAESPPRMRTDSLLEGLRSARDFLSKLRDEASSAREKHLLQVIVDTLHFISSTGQHGAFSAYLEHLEAGAPPYAIAAFDTKEAAEAWLKNQPIPPDSADVLIADTYHYVIHDEKAGVFRLPRIRALEHYLADLK